MANVSFSIVDQRLEAPPNRPLKTTQRLVILLG
jgi:hypothetical protein